MIRMSVDTNVTDDSVVFSMEITDPELRIHLQSVRPGVLTVEEWYAVVTRVYTAAKEYESAARDHSGTTRNGKDHDPS